MAAGEISSWEATSAPTEPEKIDDVVSSTSRLEKSVVNVGDGSFPAALTETAAPLHDDAAVAGRDRFRATHSGVNPKSAVA
jgi:hypothetical protein